MIGWRVDDRGAERAHEGAALFGDVCWHHQRERDAACRGVHGECCTSVAARWLKELLPRCEQPFEEEVVDQRLGGAVLNGAGWPKEFHFGEEVDPLRTRRLREERVNANERRAANHLTDLFVAH